MYIEPMESNVPEETELTYLVCVDYVKFVVPANKLHEFVQQAQQVVEGTYIEERYVYHKPKNPTKIAIYVLDESPMTYAEFMEFKSRGSDGNN